MLDGAGTSTAPQMQRDDVELLQILPEELCHRPGDEGVAEPVEAVLAQLVLPCHLRIDGIREDVLWHGGMELRVKARDVVRLGQLLEARLDNLQCGRIVQGRQVRKCLDMMVRFRIDQLGRCVVAAMHDTVARNGNVLP
jgi:hypothetical protein